MPTVLNPLINFFKPGNMSPEKKFRKAVELIIGAKPSNMEVYQLAFRHTSASKETTIKGFRESNERLEYLGDSVLGMVIA